MLNLVFARSGYGKTEYTFNRISDLVNNGREDVILIAPEQFSLYAERRLLTDLTEKMIGKVTNTSFSRIADDIRRKYGGIQLPVLSKAGKLVIMVQAIENSRDKLTLFNKKLDSLSFVQSMLNINDEMKSCNLTSADVLNLSKDIDNDTLFRKMNDIAVIMSSYERLISNTFLDTADELTRAYETIRDKGYFKGKNVFIDGFNGFVAQEYKILELVISEAESVTVTLCTDSFNTDDTFNLFRYVNDSARILKKIADKAGIETKITTLDKNFRAKSNALLHIEKNILSDKITPCDKHENVSIYSAKSITDECCEVARQIRTLLRSGYKASEITVITRELDKYRFDLGAAFKKYGVPFFNDERQPVKNQVLIVFIEYLLRAVNYSFKSDDILSLAKTGLTNISTERLSELENYIYLWNINGLKWTRPFTNSTTGFAAEFSDSDKKRLDAINATREELITPLVRFKKAVKGASAQEICAQIYYTIIAYKADEKIKELAVTLNNDNKPALAVQQGAIWDMVMNILTEIPQALGDNSINLKDFAKLFSLVVSNEDLGTLPTGIDNVQLGQADRIRCANPKAVFVIGANEGDFPRSVSGGGLLSENDRRLLLNHDFKLYSYGEILNLQERYFAYMACSAPSDRLYISYIAGSKSAAPSEIVTSVKAMFPGLSEYTFNDIDEMSLIETSDNAFELMCEHYNYNSEFYSSLKEYFSGDSRIPSVKALAENKQSKITDKDVSTKLFGYDMYISASRIEDFYSCSYKYFCKFGLGAKPRKKAEINPMERGTLIHYVLEMILSNYGSKAISQMDKPSLKALVDEYISEYFNSAIGAETDLTIRFKYNYQRLAKLIYNVVYHLSEEFKNCDFEANAFELDIDKDGRVKPEVLSLDDGGTIQIRGSIDRVDTFDNGKDKYVRVVDYKSGNKQFSLTDIMYGLNLQMFIYLFSLCEDKSSEFTGIPAGVLYMHSSRNVLSFETKRSANETIDAEESSTFKMKGIVLGDNDGEIAIAMEHELNGKYIPVKIKKSGELTGQLASLEQLGLIHKKVNSLVANMGLELHLGNIGKNPVSNKNHKAMCDWCDYKDVCANSRLIEERVCTDLTDKEVMAQLQEEFGENAEMDTTTE